MCHTTEKTPVYYVLRQLNSAQINLASVVLCAAAREMEQKSPRELLRSTVIIITYASFFRHRCPRNRWLQCIYCDGYLPGCVQAQRGKGKQRGTNTAALKCAPHYSKSLFTVHGSGRGTYTFVKKKKGNLQYLHFNLKGGARSENVIKLRMASPSLTLFHGGAMREEEMTPNGIFPRRDRPTP